MTTKLLASIWAPCLPAGRITLLTEERAVLGKTSSTTLSIATANGSFYSLSLPYSCNFTNICCLVPKGRQMCKNSALLLMKSYFGYSEESLICQMLLFHQSGIWDS